MPPSLAALLNAIQACRFNDVERLQRALDAGADPCERAQDTSALETAIASNHPQCARLIAARRPFPGYGHPARLALSEQTRLGQLDCFHAIQQGRDERSGLSALNQASLSAALRGEPEAFFEAVERGADPMALDHNGRTALMLAAYAGRSDCVKAMLDSGLCSPGYASPGPYPHSALTCAELTDDFMSRSSECVALLAPFCDCSVRLRGGESLLSSAAQAGDERAVLALLPYSDPNRKLDPGGVPAILFATLYAHNNPEAHARVAHILWPVTDLSARNRKGQTIREALLESSIGGHLQALLDQSALCEGTGAANGPEPRAPRI